MALAQISEPMPPSLLTFLRQIPFYGNALEFDLQGLCLHLYLPEEYCGLNE